MSRFISKLLPAVLLLLALPPSVACQDTDLCSGDACQPPTSSNNEVVDCSDGACAAPTEVPDARASADETSAPDPLDGGQLADATTMDATVVRRCLEDLSVCPEHAPFCYPAGGGVCVECLLTNDCLERDPNLPFCRNDAPDVDLDPSQQRCVQCLMDEHCRPLTGDEERYCVENVCTPCKDGSCSDGLVCVALGDTPAENRCLQCGDDADCQREGFSGVCDDHQCVPCANGDSLPHRGCDDSQPVCSQSSTADDSHCVVCLEHEHCPLQAPYCDEQRCVECRAEANDCGPETPVCDDGNCAACGAHQDCARFDEAPHCDEPSGSCVECLADADCTAPGAARCVENRCVPCELDTDCAHLPSQHLCHDGLCVECYGKETEACGPGRVCDMLPDSHARYTCTQLQAEQANLCEPCVSDAHCRAGADCVLTQFQGQSTGYFCLWREGGDTADSPADCRDVRLYTGSQELTSTDGRSGRYCALQYATCQALRDFGQPCDPDGDDDNCGDPELDDGLCVPYGNSSRCSYACSHEGQCLTRAQTDAECHRERYCSL